MRSTAGIVAGLFLVGLFATNCGGDDSSGGGNKGGSSTAAGQGGEGTGNTGATSNGGSSTTAGKTGTSGDAGMPAVTGCTKDADCGAAAKCVSKVCKKNDGEACTASEECQGACIDDVCTGKLDDGADCTSDDDCAHTCIDGVCAQPSDVGGDCDVDVGAGGAGTGGAPGVGGNQSIAGAGGDAPAPVVRDCKSPLQCFAGKCLNPDGEACTDNVDCLNTCVASICTPKGEIDDACDDTADCSSDKLICDLNKKKCKLDTLAQCQTNAQCQSNRCLCSNHDCSIKTCKTADSICQCRYSPTDAPSCDNSSPTLDQKSTDPNGCNGAMFCSAGNCIVNAGGACTEPCTYNPGNPNAMPAVPPSCTSAGAPVGCNGGYHGNVTTQCYIPKGTTTCAAACQCDLN